MVDHARPFPLEEGREERTSLMGEVKSRVRDITEEERAHLASRSDSHVVSAEDAADVRIREFDVAIDSVTTYTLGPDVANEGVAGRSSQSWQEKVECHVLGVGLGMIGFELCFMDYAVGSGSFPSDHVRVAFAVRPSSGRQGEWEEIETASWPVSYHWYGKPIEVKRKPLEGSQLCWEDVLPIYRFCDMEKAERSF